MNFWFAFFMGFYWGMSGLINSVVTGETFGININRRRRLLSKHGSHLLILGTSVWYCGWLVGIILFLLYFFQIAYGTIGWIINARRLFWNDDEHFIKAFISDQKMIFPMFITYLIFFIVSIFNTEFSCLKNYILHEDFGLLITCIILSVSGFIVRVIVNREISRNG